MARKRNQLSDAFQQYSKNDKKDEVKMLTVEELETVTNINNTITESENVIINSNNNTVTEDVIQNSNNDNVTDNEILLSNNEHITRNAINSSLEQVKNELLTEYEEKTKKETMEDTHVRTTFLFRKDLSKRLDKLAKSKRGFKTVFFNKAIEALLDEMEKK